MSDRNIYISAEQQDLLELFARRAAMNFLSVLELESWQRHLQELLTRAWIEGYKAGEEAAKATSHPTEQNG